MKHKMISKLTTSCFLLGLAFSSFQLSAQKQPTQNQPKLTSYQATYQVLRNGQAMAEQQTKLEQIDAHQYLLNDKTKGTHGLASFTGFKRSEGSHFIVSSNEWLVKKHNMQQKVTFSKRDYSFQQKDTINQIEGIHKKEPFIIQSFNHQPIASHMLSIRIAQLACREFKSDFHISILKSKKISQFQFKTVPSESDLIKVSRQYPEKSPKESHVWLDPNQNCLPVKTKHISDGDVIETQIIDFQLLEVVN